MDLLDVDQQPGGSIVRIAGELDAAGSTRLRELLFGTVDAAAEADAVRLDLEQVHFMDSTALGVLVAARRRALDRGVELVVVNPSPVVTKLLVTTGVDKVVPIGS